MKKAILLAILILAPLVFAGPQEFLEIFRSRAFESPIEVTAGKYFAYPITVDVNEAIHPNNVLRWSSIDTVIGRWNIELSPLVTLDVNDPNYTVSCAILSGVLPQGHYEIQLSVIDSVANTQSAVLIIDSTSPPDVITICGGLRR